MLLTWYPFDRAHQSPGTSGRTERFETIMVPQLVAKSAGTGQPVRAGEGTGLILTRWVSEAGGPGVNQTRWHEEQRGFSDFPF